MMRSNFSDNSKPLKQFQIRKLEKRSKTIQLLKRGIWLYFFLLIFEGALRKWVFPGLSEALLIVRDPIGVFMIILAWQRNLFPKVSYVTWVFIIGVLAIFTALFIGHGNLFVSLYGARILLIHFPLIFLMGSIFDRSDVIQMGKVVVWISIPMAVLIALQFYSPQSAWVNRGVGGSLSGSGFSGAMGYFRPPGTFSFTNGTTLFFSMAASFIFYFWLKPNGLNRIILLVATVGTLMAIPFSISRGLTFSIGIIFAFVLVVASRKPKFLGQIIVGSIAVLLVMTFVGEAGFFTTAADVLITRFENAARSEGGLEGTLGNRYIGGMLEAIFSSTDLPFFGQGIGMGTNAGSKMMGGGRTFLISEGEWGRLIGEMGALMGITVIAIRLLISFRLSVESFSRLKTNEVLPWMLLSFALLVFPQGQWAQPTTLGFSTMIMALLIASFNPPSTNEINSTVPATK